MTTIDDDRGAERSPALATPVQGKSRRPVLRQRIAKTARWLHIYLSMVSFAVILFFAATGLTLNHPAWFADAVRTNERSGRLDPKLLLRPGQLPSVLRTRERLHGTAEDPRVDDAQIGLSFRAPGYTADIAIDRPTGTYTVTETRNGFVAVLNDLHKGHDAGKAWSWLIDASAVLLTLVSLTGLVILWFVYKRRTSGLLLAVVGCALLLLSVRVFVP